MSTNTASLTWNPEIPGQQVRLKGNPGRQGITTGETMMRASRLHVRIEFGPNEQSFKRYDQLEIVPKGTGLRDLLSQGEFGTPEDLRRIIVLEKIKGELTNIFYSMGSSNADFYAHQFKPVLKFLDSPVGRLLIADEVGLGKTIESIYIWKELDARESARRLLIVCPAILRDKWKNDLIERFGIYAEVLSAKDLLGKIDSFLSSGEPSSFVGIASLEGIRVKNWDDSLASDSRIKLANLMEQNPATRNEPIFDLVIIDESHYLRTPGTANNKLGELLRDASKHLLLLTATPIQIQSTNLYQLLKLISPSDFFDTQIFEGMLQDNKFIINAQRELYKKSPNLTEIRETLESCLKSRYFQNSKRLKKLVQDINEIDTITPKDQIQFNQTLESISLFGQFMTRSRKREVMKDKRVQRRPQTLDVLFTEIEKEVYQYVSHKIRIQAQGQSTFNVFRLMGRQRQMASCLVASLQDWQEKGILEDFSKTEADEELLYEIYGSDIDLAEEYGKQFNDHELNSLDFEVEGNPIPQDPEKFQNFIEDLKRKDSKYKELAEFLKGKLANNPEEKFVLFAFYRKTLTYLEERLSNDGINVCLIVGGLSREDKQERLETFKQNPRISVLLSSEVGSEGIDLQFCQHLINYDLPWNPMRIEQRIGRLDRLNQQSPVIIIINLSVKDTIEEYILETLYKRIKIFEHSIGDLEEILGQKTEELILSLLDLNLTEDEAKEEAHRKVLAYAQSIEDQRKLEEQAINLAAFSDFILDRINYSKREGRWLKPSEIKSFVDDFFSLQYPGTTIIPDEKELIHEIKLSKEAKNALKQFISDKKFKGKPTQLSSRAVNCLFDPKRVDEVGKKHNEVLDVNHPLIQWIRSEYEKSDNTCFQLYPLSASEVSLDEWNANPQFSVFEGVESGIFLYIVHLWKFEGFRKESRLQYKVLNVATQKALPDSSAEGLINFAICNGKEKPNAINSLNMNLILESYDLCKGLIEDDYIQASDHFESENEDKGNFYVNSIETYRNRRVKELQERIDRYQAENKLKMIAPTQGLIDKIKNDCENNLKRVDDKRNINDSFAEKVVGLVFVKE